MREELTNLFWNGSTETMWKKLAGFSEDCYKCFFLLKPCQLKFFLLHLMTFLHNDSFKLNKTFSFILLLNSKSGSIFVPWKQRVDWIIRKQSYEIEKMQFKLIPHQNFIIKQKPTKSRFNNSQITKAKCERNRFERLNSFTL